jgi:cytochrome P450
VARQQAFANYLATDTTEPRSIRKSIRLIWGSITYRVICFFLNHHLPFKLAFALLRRVRPVAAICSAVVVTKAGDVRDVLDRFDDFQLGEVIRPGMPWGPFLMTVDWREQHMHERELLQRVVRPGDSLYLKTLAAQQCREQLHALRRAKRDSVDVVSELAEPVMVAVADKYFGLPPIGGDEKKMARTMSDIASLIMVGPPEGSHRWRQQRASIVALSNHVDDQIRAKSSAPAPASADDLLTRLAQLLSQVQRPWFDADWVRRHVIGLAGTGGATIVRATTHALDQLVARPAALQRARAQAARLVADEATECQLAHGGADQKQSDAARARTEQSLLRLRQSIYEALRFRPMLPLLVRYCPRETILAKDAKRARLVHAGSRVLAPPLAAMFDPKAMEMPWRFCSSRPLEDFLHFGHGDRSCFGRYVADVVMLEIIRALLRLPDLVRVAGLAGSVRYDGPVPRSLVLCFKHNR